MGESGRATCRACGHGFELSSGGGFVVEIVFCEDCGRGQGVARGSEPAAGDDPGEIVGRCARCGGTLRRDASPRCPRCRSAELEIDPPHRLWD